MTKRMSLSSVSRGRIQQPLRVLLYGTEKLGKSTFASEAPAPIFICAEDGTAQLDIARFPEPKTWPEIIEAIRELGTEKHDYRTLVIDSVDWAEPLLWKHICQRDGKRSIEDYGYGRGHVAALDEWRLFLAALEQLRRTANMHVVLLAHAFVRKFSNPEGEDFDRFSLKMNEKAAGLLKEWSDAVLFANYETHAIKEKEGGKVKGFGGGARYIYTERRAAWDAGNRFGLPPRLPLNWAEFEAGIAAGANAATELRDAIEAALPSVPEPKRTEIRTWLSKPDIKVDALRVALNRVNGLKEAE